MGLFDIFLFSLIPATAMGVSSLIALWKSPGEKLQSAVQHFTAGVVLAAAVFELVPDLDTKNNLPSVTIGFLVGVTLMLLIRKYFDAEEEGDSSQKQANATIVPATFLAAIGIDLFIDGMLLGLAYAVAGTQGAVFMIALTLEVIFLALGSVVTLTAKGLSQKMSVGIQFALAAIIPVGAMIGAVAVEVVSEPFKIAFLAFGVAALLYLVTEELLVEAHEVEDSAVATAMFFIGFLIILLIDGAEIL